MKKTIIIILFTIVGYSAHAQQDAMFTHYMFNTIAVNPAYAGSRDALTITGLHRSQWVGFDGAPTTQTLTLHTPILNQNSGIGLSFINDKIGPTNTTSFYVDFSYRIKVSEKAKLAFGLKGGMNMMNHNLTDLSLTEQNDPAFINDVQSKLLPNFGFGMYYYTDKFYAGVSVPKLLENNFITNSTSGTTNLASEKRHYFLIAGSVFDLNEEIKFRPTAFMKVTNGAPIEGDITASFIFNEKFWLGAMFRTGDAVGLLAGVNITDQLALGYSFDWSYANTTMKYNGGSHELMLRYDFIYKTEEKIRSPRYF
ncbi:MAG: type IX secretion system membrane protein PorP/SprF [Bacteroidales bacterium]|nr:type IX secretion system membrane protein PorP/SprF [Bacteroidales bacterium]